jgi:protein TonB
VKGLRAGVLLSVAAHAALAGAIVTGFGKNNLAPSAAPLTIDLVAIATPTPLPPAPAAPPAPSTPVAPRSDAALATAIAEPAADPVTPAPDPAPSHTSPRHQIALAAPHASMAPAPAAPAAPPGPSAPSAGSTAAAGAGSPPSADWLRAIAAWLAAHRTYPEQARRKGEQGTVVLRLVIARDGTVREATLLESSGHADLDRASLAVVTGAHLPASPSADAPTELMLRAPMRYALEPSD